MKFIREIISGKHDAAGRGQSAADHRSGQDALPPQARAAAGRRDTGLAPADDAADDLYRLVEGAAWLRPEGKSDLSRNIAAAIQEREEDPADEAYARPGVRPEAARPAGDTAPADAIDEDEFELGEDDDFSLTDDDDEFPGDDDLEADDPGLFDEDDTVSDTGTPVSGKGDADDEADDRLWAPERRAPPAPPLERAAATAMRQDRATAAIDRDDPARRGDDVELPPVWRSDAPVPDRRPTPEQPPVQTTPRPHAEREVTQLRGIRQDPFDRLVAAQPAPDAASPVQRMPDRQPATPPARPRTRLADNLAMPGSMPKPAQVPTPAPTPGAAPDGFEVPAPAVGRAARRAERVKTRLLGFGGGQGERNPFEAASDAPATAAAKFPVGWMVVTGGPGRGHSFTLLHGVSQIGRGEDQAIRLDFGDTSISRSNHAAIAYDPENRKFFLGHGGKANLVRLNGKPVLSTEELPPGGVIHIGETTLQFVALCGAGFDWDKNHDDDVDTAVFG